MSSRRRLRAPAGAGEILCEPSLADLPALWARNLHRESEFGASPYHDGSWVQIRRQCRRELVRIADWPTGAPDAGDDPRIVLTGHQPELFHPGVWFKNFVASGLRRPLGAVSIHLVVDCDTAKSTGLRLPVPGAGREPARLLRVDFDHFRGEIPYEELGVSDDAYFQSFPDRVELLTERWNFVPLLREFWHACTSDRLAKLGQRFVTARRTFEARWNCVHGEVSASRLCQTPWFGWFAWLIVRDLARYRQVHDEVVRRYRQAHRIRSRSHPVPELASDQGWLEAPFWVWRSDEPRRRRLFVHPVSDRVVLRAGDVEFADLPLVDRDAFVDEWMKMERRGWKVRTRALTTTLFARLFWCDLFLHGIGGAVYDELTDAISRRFLGIELPGYVALSATFRLPFPACETTPVERRAVARHLRDVAWNPQRYLPAPEDPAVRTLTGRREQLIENTSLAAKRRFDELRSVNGALRRHLGPELESALRVRLADLNRRLADEAILGRRDFAFCLFPERQLREFYARFA